MDRISELIEKFSNLTVTPREACELTREGVSVSMTARDEFGLPAFFFRADEEKGFAERLTNAAETYGIKIEEVSEADAPIKGLLKKAQPSVFYVNTNCDGCSYFYGRGVAACVMDSVAVAQGEADDEERENEDPEDEE